MECTIWKLTLFPLVPTHPHTRPLASRRPFFSAVNGSSGRALANTALPGTALILRWTLMERASLLNSFICLFVCWFVCFLPVCAFILIFGGCPLVPLRSPPRESDAGRGEVGLGGEVRGGGEACAGGGGKEGTGRIENGRRWEAGEMKKANPSEGIGAGGGGCRKGSETERERGRERVRGRDRE